MPAAVLDERGDLAAEPRLADPGRPDDGDQVRRAARRARDPDRPHQLDLAARPTSASRPAARPGPGTALDGEPRRDGLGLSLGVDRPSPSRSGSRGGGPICLRADDQAARRRGGLQPRGGVDDVAGRERARRLRPASSETTASPVFTAARAARSRPVPRFSSSIPSGREPARTARSASSPCAIGAPKTAITASPMNFSSTPPYCSIPRFALRVVDLQRVADVLGIGAVRPRREADEVDEEDRDELPLLVRHRLLERRPAAGAVERVGGGRP